MKMSLPNFMSRCKPYNAKSYVYIKNLHINHYEYNNRFLKNFLIFFWLNEHNSLSFYRLYATLCHTENIYSHFINLLKMSTILPYDVRHLYCVQTQSSQIINLTSLILFTRIQDKRTFWYFFSGTMRIANQFMIFTIATLEWLSNANEINIYMWY